MIPDFLVRLLRLGRSRGQAAPALPETSVPDALFTHSDGFPHVDWDFAELWAANTSPDPAQTELYLRAVAAAWLERVADAASGEHAVWRRRFAEGIAPIAGGMHSRVAGVCDRTFLQLAGTLKPIRGDSPPGAVCIVVLATNEDYYSLRSPFQGDGEFAASGGCYIREGFPLLVLPAVCGGEVEATIAHELTHHFLADLSLPLWVEEGLTQMMEERVAGRVRFHFDRETAERHARHWREKTLEGFWTGEAFRSPEEDSQELSYNLAQVLVRPLLADNRRAFFRFAQGCAELGSAESAERHLGVSLGQLAARVLGPGDWEPSFDAR